MAARSTEVPRQIVAVSALSSPGAGSIPISATPKLGASAFLRLTLPDGDVVAPVDGDVVTNVVVGAVAGTSSAASVALSATGDTAMLTGAASVALSAKLALLALSAMMASSALPEMALTASSIEVMVGIASALSLS